MTCIIDSLASAIEISRNFINKPELNPAQTRTLNMAMDFISLCRKFFDININTKELEVLQEWEAKDKQVRNIFLAKKSNKHYLYVRFYDTGAKALGIFINDAELPKIQSMSNTEALSHYNEITINNSY
jgi:hypothetical protein